MRRDPREDAGVDRPSRDERSGRGAERRDDRAPDARGERRGAGRADTRGGGRRDDRGDRRDGGRGAGRRDERAGGRPERVPPRRVEVPRTEAERRAAEVKARRGPVEPRTPAPPPAWEPEQWIDEDALRSEAEDATLRATGERRTGRRMSGEVAPEVAAELAKVAPANRLARYQERLTTAADALDRGRFGDARRMVQPVLRDLPDLAFAHEIAGLALYRMGEWRKAAAELETVRRLSGTFLHHAVLADCYRALRRYSAVEELWRELREASPEPALMAEGRIVAAGALADQGDLAGALKVMQKAMDVPKKPREHHLRQWYVVADLLDRSGDVVKARHWFSLVASVDAEFADVRERLRTLGR